jgi:lipopolysaccharide heptosyltransferase I
VSHRFLIVRLGSLGDVIHAIPTAAGLRARFPDARIDWLVDPRYVPLLEIVRGIDSRIPVNTRRLGQTLSTLRDLRRVGYTAVLDMQGLLKSALLARAVRAERTIGFERGHLRERTAAPFYSHRITPAGGAHVIFKNLALLEPLGPPPPRLRRDRDPQVSFPIDIPHSEAADAVRSRVGGEPYALINPGAAWPNKRWPSDRFGALAAAMRDRLGLRSFVLWGPGEETLAEQVSGASGGAAELAPATAIPDLFAIARHARVLISGDTGPLHIGGAVGTPLVALFGPTLAERNGPWSTDDVVVSRTKGCVCLYRRRCRRGAPCIDEIQLPEVIDAVERRLSRRSA